MNVLVDLIVLGFMLFIGLTIFSLFYEKLKPVVDKLFPSKPINFNDVKKPCPNCGVLLKVDIDGFHCGICGYEKIVKYEPQ